MPKLEHVLYNFWLHVRRSFLCYHKWLEMKWVRTDAGKVYTDTCTKCGKKRER
jgi:hypothetical protein